VFVFRKADDGFQSLVISADYQELGYRLHELGFGFQDVNTWSQGANDDLKHDCVANRYSDVKSILVIRLTSFICLFIKTIFKEKLIF
jgi:hypothetical protein